MQQPVVLSVSFGDMIIPEEKEDFNYKSKQKS